MDSPFLFEIQINNQMQELKEKHIELIARTITAENKNDFVKWNVSFPEGQRPELDWLLNNGFLTGYYIVKDKQQIPCAATFSDIIFNSCFFLFWLAVFPEFRDYGIGSQILKFLYRKASGMNCRMYFLIEDPYQENATETEVIQRMKRLSFYERNGFHFTKNIKYTGSGIHFWIGTKDGMISASEADTLSNLAQEHLNNIIEKENNHIE